MSDEYFYRLAINPDMYLPSSSYATCGQTERDGTRMGSSSSTPEYLDPVRDFSSMEASSSSCIAVNGDVDDDMDGESRTETPGGEVKVGVGVEAEIEFENRVQDREEGAGESSEDDDEEEDEEEEDEEMGEEEEGESDCSDGDGDNDTNNQVKVKKERKEPVKLQYHVYRTSVPKIDWREFACPKNEDEVMDKDTKGDCSGAENEEEVETSSNFSKDNDVAMDLDSDDEDPLQYESDAECDYDDDENETEAATPPTTLNQVDIVSLKAAMLALLPGERFLKLPPVAEYMEMHTKEELIDLLVKHLDLDKVIAYNTKTTKSTITLTHPEADKLKLIKAVYETEKEEEETVDCDFLAGLREHSEEALRRLLSSRLAQMTSMEIYDILVEPKASLALLAIMELYGSAASSGGECERFGFGSKEFMDKMNEKLKDVAEDW
ncbi:uncharacterized protein BDV17DRAFT_288426 [Aspergillus undulatus]|uniref:uncharacterized protein n=1 Tax=Aspergillus undulatus TaxID=1810928 RepID=UPI003CCD1EA3